MQWMKASVRLAMAGVLGLLFVAPARADDVAEAEKIITEALGKIKSISYKLVATSDYSAQGVTNKISQTATVQAIHAGDKWKQHADAEMSMTQGANGQESKNDSKAVSVFDGEFYYTLSESNGQKMAFKTKPDPGVSTNPFDGKALFNILRETYNIKRLPDAKIDGRDCVVLEFTPKDPAAGAAGPIARMTANYCKKTGQQIKSETFNAEGKVLQSMVISDIKLDEDIKQDRFEFKAPEGVAMIDNTKPAEKP